jgi:large subunit ribosomal protein L10
VIKDFAKANDKLVTTSLSIGGGVLAAKDLEKVASLPTKEQALSMLLGVMKAPLQKLAGTLQAAPVKLVRTVVAIRDQKQAAG